MPDVSPHGSDAPVLPALPDPLDFPKAIAWTQRLLDCLERQTVPAADLEAAIAAAIAQRDGARGFFVGYLTDERDGVEAATATVARACATAAAATTELLVKNLAMSSAMVLAHNRNGDESMAASSRSTARRTAAILAAIADLARRADAAAPVRDRLRAECLALAASATDGGGDYAEFLDRWGYDGDQRRAIAAAARSAASTLAEPPVEPARDRRTGSD